MAKDTLKYEQLSAATEARIRADRTAGGIGNLYAFDDRAVVRRDGGHDRASLIRPAFTRDSEKILHSPYYNRYTDKTQVFSFYKNDDITRRALHVQLVCRIARTVGQALGLNLSLLEAISLGHDIGHTPFGHAGERFLDELLCAHTGRHFSHNIHSVRVLDEIFPLNLTLQTLSGIAAHDGELELREYHPQALTDFTAFDAQIEACYTDKTAVRRLVPSTLEGCVMRVADIIAYLGKDRQDAERAGLVASAAYEGNAIGTYNAEMINNLIVNIVENSYGKPYIAMDATHFAGLKQAKEENYALIYKNAEVTKPLDETVEPMMQEMYERLLSDLMAGNTASPIFFHHIATVDKPYYRRTRPYLDTEPNQIVTDYIASMTDDYFVDLYKHLFPHSKRKIEYIGYFD